MFFASRPCVSFGAAVGGKTEGEGPCAEEFDFCYDNDDINQKTWEQAEQALQREAMQRVLQKANLPSQSVDVLLSGDLLDQCVASSAAAKELKIPMTGLYGACSTFALGLCLAGLFVETQAAKRALVCASSHFCAAEKQFRFPLEYGSQRPPTTQRTATAAGAVLVENNKQGCCIEAAMLGTVVDAGITDAANMGAAMAPVSVKLEP